MKISTILDHIDSGHMALPEFQRGYVWNGEQVKGRSTRSTAGTRWVACWRGSRKRSRPPIAATGRAQRASSSCCSTGSSG